MTSRIARLWQPGNPQIRVFLPDFWMRLVETPSTGPRRLMKNCACFEVDPRMNEHDIRQYLEKIYQLPVRDVRTQMIDGEIQWDLPLDRRNRRALWKKSNKKKALVFFRRDVQWTFPDLFTTDQEQVELERAKANQERTNAQDVRSKIGRNAVAEWFP